MEVLKYHSHELRRNRAPATPAEEQGAAYIVDDYLRSAVRTMVYTLAFGIDVRRTEGAGRPLRLWAVFDTELNKAVLIDNRLLTLCKKGRNLVQSYRRNKWMGMQHHWNLLFNDRAENHSVPILSTVEDLNAASASHIDSLSTMKGSEMRQYVSVEDERQTQKAKAKKKGGRATKKKQAKKSAAAQEEPEEEPVADEFEFVGHKPAPQG